MSCEKCDCGRSPRIESAQGTALKIQQGCEVLDLEKPVRSKINKEPVVLLEVDCDNENCVGYHIAWKDIQENRWTTRRYSAARLIQLFENTPKTFSLYALYQPKNNRVFCIPKEECGAYFVMETDSFVIQEIEVEVPLSLTQSNWKE